MTVTISKKSKTEIAYRDIQYIQVFEDYMEMISEDTTHIIVDTSAIEKITFNDK